MNTYIIWLVTVSNHSIPLCFIEAVTQEFARMKASVEYSIPPNMLHAEGTKRFLNMTNPLALGN